MSFIIFDCSEGQIIKYYKLNTSNILFEKFYDIWPNFIDSIILLLLLLFVILSMY